MRIFHSTYKITGIVFYWQLRNTVFLHDANYLFTRITLFYCQ